MTIWNVAMLVVGMVFAGWSLRLRASGDPTWKLGAPAALASFGLASEPLLPQWLWISITMLATLLTFFATHRFMRDLQRELR